LVKRAKMALLRSATFVASMIPIILGIPLSSQTPDTEAVLVQDF
jgi:hypothetical protein